LLLFSLSSLGTRRCLHRTIPQPPEPNQPLLLQLQDYLTIVGQDRQAKPLRLDWNDIPDWRLDVAGGTRLQKTEPQEPSLSLISFATDYLPDDLNPPIEARREGMNVISSAFLKSRLRLPKDLSHLIKVHTWLKTPECFQVNQVSQEDARTSLDEKVLPAIVADLRERSRKGFLPGRTAATCRQPQRNQEAKPYLLDTTRFLRAHSSFHIMS
jgi:hypothetical protein